MAIRADITRAPGRIVGPGRLLRTLRQLIARVDRYALHRARIHDEHVWAACLADRLDGLMRDALDSPQAAASLALADRRAAVISKCGARDRAATRRT
jgi:hypothetical protein